MTERNFVHSRRRGCNTVIVVPVVVVIVIVVVISVIVIIVIVFGRRNVNGGRGNAKEIKDGLWNAAGACLDFTKPQIFALTTKLALPAFWLFTVYDERTRGAVSLHY